MRLSVLNWSTDVNGLGRAYREMLGIKRFLPLPFNSDHGVTVYPFLEEHELNSRNKLHFTWYKYRKSCVENTADTCGKVIKLCPCPLIYLRKKYFPRPKINNGTVCFLPHSTDRMKNNYDPVDLVYRVIRDKTFSPPFKFFIHPRDARNGQILSLIKNLSSKEIIFLNLKDNLDYDFILNFYKEIDGFEHGVSFTLGTEVLLCSEYGLKHRLLEMPFEKTIVNPTADIKKQMQYLKNSSEFSKLIYTFKYEYADPNAIQKVVNEMLSVDLLNDAYLAELRREILWEYLKLPANYMLTKLSV